MDKGRLVVAVVLLEVLGLGLIALAVSGHLPGGLTSTPLGLIPLTLAGLLVVRNAQRECAVVAPMLLTGVVGHVVDRTIRTLPRERSQALRPPS